MKRIAMKQVARLVVAPLAALALVASVTSCAGGPSKPTVDTDAPLVVAVTSFDGDSSLSWMVKAGDMRIYAPLFSHLATTDPETKEVLPQMAESWESSEDGKTWTIHLKKDIPYNDPEYGTVTSEDVAYQIEQFKSEGAAGSDLAYWKPVTVATPDDLTVVVTFPNPTWEFAYHLTPENGYLNIQPKAYVEAVGAAKAAVEPVGTGPYVQTSYSPGVEHVYEAVEDHWNATPEFTHLTIKAIADQSAQLNGLRAGEIDIVRASGDILEQAESDGLRVIKVDDATQEYMTLPGMARPGSPNYDPSLPWIGDDNDPESAKNALLVREALNLAINRDAIFDGLWNGEANRDTFNYTYFPWQAGYKDSWELLPYDPDKAKELLAEAGYPNGFTFPVASTAIPSAPDAPDVTAAIVQDLERVGITVDSIDIDYASLAPKFLDRTLDRAWIYGSFVRPEPSMMYNVMSSTKGAAGILVERDQFQVQLDAIKAELDPDKRAALTSKLGQDMYDYLPAIMIGTRPVTWVVSDRVGDWPTLPVPEATKLDLITAAG